MNTLTASVELDAHLRRSLHVHVEQQVHALLPGPIVLRARRPVQLAVDLRPLQELRRAPSWPGTSCRSTKWYCTPSVSPARGPRVVWEIGEAQAVHLGQDAGEDGRLARPRGAGHHDQAGLALTQRSAPARARRSISLLEGDHLVHDLRGRRLAADGVDLACHLLGQEVEALAARLRAVHRGPGLGHVAAQPLQLLRDVVPLDQADRPPGRGARRPGPAPRQGADLLRQRRRAARAFPSAVEAVDARRRRLDRGRSAAAEVACRACAPSASRIALPARPERAVDGGQELGPAAPRRPRPAPPRPRARPGSAPRPPPSPRRASPCSRCDLAAAPRTSPATIGRGGHHRRLASSSVIAACTDDLDAPAARSAPAPPA